VARETKAARHADDLFALADIARLSGHADEAVAPLERLLELYPSNPRAAVAALTLGRIQLAQGRPAQAAVALTRALAIGAPAGLEQDTYARLVEAQARAGQHARARASAQRYIERFPNGNRRAEVERWAEQ
jgi:transmembrane sensor